MMAGAMYAQPAKRRTTTGTTQRTQATTERTAVDRASLMFPTSDAMPEDVSWRRDIYRVVNLLDNDKNAALYYPVQPIGKQCNLFTYLFRLVLTGRVTAYKYTLDGNETFTDKNRIQIKEMLDNYKIYYEEKDGKYVVADVDVPSEHVTRYYIKESNYLDQYTNDTRTKVTALCPVLMEVDDFGDVTPTPIFWVKYDDISSYLAKLPVMTSNLNNVTNMTADDYFTLNRYDADIYKTNNMRGLILMNYCESDTALHKEQARIEKELSDFSDHLWNGGSDRKAAEDSMAVASSATKASKKAAKTDEKSEKAEEPEKEVVAEKKANSRRPASSSTATKKSKSSTSAPAATKEARVSVRRQRR